MGGNAAIHDHHRLLRRVQLVEHILEAKDYLLKMLSIDA